MRFASKMNTELERTRHPKMIPAMTGAIENLELRFANAEKVRKRSVS
jgi:hypothetical protein